MRPNSLFQLSFGSSAVFKWKGQSCPDDDANLCCLGRGDKLVMDGQCQDKFLHRTDPCREQERKKRYVPLDHTTCIPPGPLFKAGVACCLPTCAQGSSVPSTGEFLG